MQPPRIPVLISGERSVIYFITICVKDRQRVLNTQTSWQRTKDTLARLNRWSFNAVIQMPDHLHLLAAPMIDRDESVSNLLMWFKR